MIRPGALAAWVCLALIGAAVWSWSHWHEEIAPDARWRLTPERVSIPPSPDWLDGDIKRTVFQSGELADISLRDTDALQRVIGAFAVQPWVESIVRGEKVPQGIRLDVRYRRPVAVVEVGAMDLLPVDAAGVALDGRDLSAAFARDCWRISLVQPMAGPIALGRPSSDVRVRQAAAIAAFWIRSHAGLGWFRVVCLSDATVHDADPICFELWNRDNARVLWGSAPGWELPGEGSAEQKRQVLIDYVGRHGWPDPTEKLGIDVRDGRALPVPLG
jgi:hypothetical protein